MENLTILSALSKIDCREETKVLFGSIFNSYQFKRKQKVVVPNQAAHPIYFLSSGILQLGQSATSASEIKTLRFFKPGSFIMMPESTDNNNPQSELTAITDCVVQMTDFHNVEQLYQTDRDIAKIMLSVQDAWNKEANEELVLLRTSSLQRYTIFFEKMGIYRLHIPQKQLASYLSISLKHLGRLQKDYLKTK